VRICRMRIQSGQQGVALLMAMLFLVIITLIGIASMTGTTLEERMARNYRETNIAFQAAEAALRDAETDMTGGAGVTRAPLISPTDAGFTGAPGSCSATGECTPATSAPQVWDWNGGTSSMLENTNTSVRYGTYTGKSNFLFPISAQNIETGYVGVLLPSMGVAKQPRYVVEYLGVSGAQNVYRITAIGYGPTPTTKVILQEEVLH
jgi:type IV pilus assembly protein PilX